MASAKGILGDRPFSKWLLWLPDWVSMAYRQGPWNGRELKKTNGAPLGRFAPTLSGSQSDDH